MVGSPLRSAMLAGLALALTASSFDNVAVSSSAYLARYVFAGLLLVLTGIQGREHNVPLRDLPGPCRLLIRSAWLLATLAAISTAWSIAPRETGLQAAAFVLLVANMHVHVVRRWHDQDALVADMRTIFWVLSASVTASFFVGALVGSRLAGLYDNPNHLGIIAMFTAAIGAGLYLENRRPILVASSAVAVLAVLATGSRTALIGTVLAALPLAARRRWSPILVLAACFGGSALILLYLLSGRLPLPSTAERFHAQGSESIFDDRQRVWRFAFRIWELQPITGHGFRTGEISFSQWRYMADGSPIGATHNSYLQVLVELGYLGMIPLAGLILAMGWALLRHRFVGIRAGLASLVIAGLISGLTESALFGLGSAISWTFWLGAAALTVTATSPSRRTRDSARTSRQAITSR